MRNAINVPTHGKADSNFGRSYSLLSDSNSSCNWYLFLRTTVSLDT